MNNIPVVKLGIIAVSRDCFPIELSEKDVQPLKLLIAETCMNVR